MRITGTMPKPWMRYQVHVYLRSIAQRIVMVLKKFLANQHRRTRRPRELSSNPIKWLEKVLADKQECRLRHRIGIWSEVDGSGVNGGELG